MTPSTFEQAQARFYGRALVAAGVAIGCATVALIAVLVWGGWPTDLFGAIITILGVTAGGAQGILLYVIHALAIGGPVKNSQVILNKEGVNLKTEGD